MSGRKRFGLLLMTMVSLAGAVASSASAVTWDPLNTNVGPATGVLTLTTNGAGGGSITCSYGSYLVARSASPSVANTTNSAGASAGPTWSGCSNTISAALRTCVTSSSSWLLSATATSLVTMSNINMVIDLRSPGTATCNPPTGTVICRMVISSASVSSLNWTNGPPSTLTMNSASSFAMVQTGICNGATRAVLSGSVRVPTATIR
jgi:hypothetical protein